MPPSFRRDTCKSFGHFKSMRRPVACSIPSASATPADSVNNIVALAESIEAAGVSTTDTYRPERGGENQVWPRRPRPCVCSLATTTRPSRGLGAGDWELTARAIATSWVEPMVSKNRIVDASRPRRARARSIASTRSRGGSEAPPEPRRSGWFDFKADVDRWRGVCQGADGHEVGTRRSELVDTRERHTAGDFDFRAAAGTSDRLANAIGRHVVDEDRFGARDDRLVDLRQRFGLDFNRQPGTIGTRMRDGGGDAPCEADVVVLDQIRVEQARAMIRRPTGADGVLLQQPQHGRRLARVEDGDASTSGIDELPCARGNARQALEEIERRAFTHQQRPRRADDPGNRLTRAARVPVALCGREHRLRRLLHLGHLAKRFERDVQTGKHAIGLHEQNAAAHQRRGNRGLGRDVSGAHILVERAGDEVSIQGGIQGGHAIQRSELCFSATGSYPSTTIARGSPGAASNACTRKAARRSASTIGSSASVSASALTRTLVIGTLSGCLASDLCLRTSNITSFAD